MTSRLRFRGMATLLALQGLLSACGGGASPGAAAVNPAAPEPASAYTLAVDPQPLSVTVSGDDSRQVAQDLPLDGGTLVATGADGTQYILTVPGNALLEATRIVMTPLANGTELPFGDAMRGVQLSPEGLHFMAPVRLDIRLPAGTEWPVVQQIPVTLQGSRNMVSLALLDPKAAVPGFQLMHFSSYALVLAKKGIDATLNPLRHRLGGDAETRIESAAAELLARDRQRQLLSIPYDFDASVADMHALQQQYDTEVVAVRLAAAGTGCAAFRLATQTLLGRRREMELWSDQALESDDTYDKLRVMSPMGAWLCMKEEFELCRDEHIISRVIPVYLGLRRQSELMGGSWSIPAEAIRYVEKCLRFELQLNASTDYADDGMGTGHPHTMSERVESRVRISLVDFDGTGESIILGRGLAGPRAPLISRGYRVAATEGCNRVTAVQGFGGELGVFKLGWELKDGGVAERARVKDFSLVLDLSNGVRSSYTLLDGRKGACDDPAVSVEDDNWSSTAGSVLFSQQFKDKSGLPELTGISDWVMHIGSAQLATKEIDATETDLYTGTRLRASLALVHTPASD